MSTTLFGADPADYLTLPQAASLLPGKGGKPLNHSTLWKWVHRGYRAPNGEVIKLAVIRIGRVVFTTRKNVEAFAEATALAFEGREAAASC